MKQGFICTAAAIILCGSCLAVSDDLMRAFDKALSDPDISVCWDAAAPLWGRAQMEGFFANYKEPSNLLTLLVDRVLEKRIDIEDADRMVEKRFQSMQYFMDQIAFFEAVARTNVCFLKLADYLATENVIPLTNWTERAKLAREKDEALIAAGVIKRPIVIIGTYPRTPNRRALWDERDRITHCNNRVIYHRSRVADIFAKRMEEYLHSLNEEEAEAFCKRFIKRAGLTEAEEDLFFPERAKKKPKKQGIGAQQEEHIDDDISTPTPDVKEIEQEEPIPKEALEQLQGKRRCL
ncbi:MAG: hypothetical protein J5985_01190 [Kiritimatiellae bacterium]|nr:hypothetical protein [Kiritimatiellia bacterium]